MSDAFKQFIERREAQIKNQDQGKNWLWILLGLACAAVLIYLVLKGNPATGPVNPNTATAEQLVTLEGVGPEIAQKIIAGRPYSKIEDLTKVPGIGPKTLERMKPRLSLEQK